MKELLEYRVKLIHRMREITTEFRAACEAAAVAKLEDNWTPHQIAAHTRDVEKFVYGERIRRTIAEDNPHFENFDADAWMSEHYNPNEPLPAILDDFSASMEDLCRVLETLPQEAWSRVGQHEIMGGELTMQIWVERNLAHIVEHLNTMKKVEKR